MEHAAKTIFARLRELLKETDLNLVQLSGRTKISYDKLRRFSLETGLLSLEDAEKLHIEFTGKTFIETKP